MAKGRIFSSCLKDLAYNFGNMAVVRVVALDGTLHEKPIYELERLVEIYKGSAGQFDLDCADSGLFVIDGDGIWRDGNGPNVCRIANPCRRSLAIEYALLLDAYKAQSLNSVYRSIIKLSGEYMTMKKFSSCLNRSVRSGRIIMTQTRFDSKRLDHIGAMLTNEGREQVRRRLE